MILGFSNMGGGSGLELNLVYILEASVFRNSQDFDISLQLSNFEPTEF